MVMYKHHRSYFLLGLQERFQEGWVFDTSVSQPACTMISMLLQYRFTNKLLFGVPTSREMARDLKNDFEYVALVFVYVRRVRTDCRDLKRTHIRFCF
jgi:ribosome-associated toxin RatA of RatAB toxin-antitoxin module